MNHPGNSRRVSEQLPFWWRAASCARSVNSHVVVWQHSRNVRDVVHATGANPPCHAQSNRQLRIGSSRSTSVDWQETETFRRQYKVSTGLRPGRTPSSVCSNCVLDTTKLLAAGITMRPVLEALEDSLRNWKAEN